MSPDSRSPFNFERPSWQAGVSFRRFLAVFAAAMFVTSEISRVYAAPFDSYVGFWLPSGVYVTGLLLSETRRWAWLVGAALVTTLLSDMIHLNNLWMSAGFGMGNAVESLLGAWLVRRFVAPRPSLQNIREFIGFVGYGVLLAPIVGATIGAAVILASGGNHVFGASWLTWWASESIGILLVAPVLLVTLAPSRAAFFPSLKARGALEMAILFVLITAGAWLVAVQLPSTASAAKYALLPLLLWAGIRFGVRGAAVANLFIGLVLGFFAAHGLPGATGTVFSSTEFPSNFYLFLFVASLVSLAPAVVLRERDQLLARLSASEENVRLLLEGVQDCAIFMLDPDGNIASWTAAAARLTGFSAVEVVGRPVTLLMPPEERDSSPIGALLAIARAEGKAESEGWRVRKDGSRFYSAVLAPPLRDSGGAVRGYAKIIRDVSVRRAWETKLVEESRKNEALLQTAVDGIHIFDLDGNVVQVNDAFCRHLGYTRQELMGMNVAQWEVQRTGGALVDHIRGIPMEGVVFETRHRRKDGSMVEVEISATWVEIEGRRLMYASARDITARKALEEQLRQSQKLEAVGRLAGGVAHDFNNILTGMLLNLEMIELDRQLPERVLQPFKDLKAMARRAAGITEQLLLFARRHSMHSEALELNGVLENVLKMISRLLGEHIAVNLHRGVPELWVQGDSGMLDQVVMNISINARDSMPDGGELRFETSLVEFDQVSAAGRGEARPGRFACVCVSDTGSGIPSEVLPHIFEPFYTTKEVGKGTGLGLATVDGIIHQHKGWVTVDSEVGKGTTFRVYLPASGRQAGPARAPGLLGMSGGRERILLVEDEDSVRTVAAAILRRLGYEVFVASDGNQALSLWDQSAGKFDLLLTDMVMPGGLGGMQLATRLRKSDPALKVIVMSGYNEQIMGGETLRDAGFLFLSKPFETSVLAGIIREALGRDGTA
jgi:PAS domain S-box-containing protein